MKSSKLLHKQKGAALIISMLMLIIITIIGVSGMNTSSLEEKMAGNTNDRYLAFQAAESALRAAEESISANLGGSMPLSDFDTDGSDGLYDDSLDNIWTQVDWSGTDAGNDNEAITHSGFGGTTASDPKYVIEHTGSVDEAADTLNLGNYGENTGAGNTEFFRITARGVGGSANAVVILQTTYGRKL